jgi:hypothetical protein
MREIVIPLPTAVDDSITERVKRLAARHWGGWTAQEATGGWQGPDGETVTEPVEVITVVADGPHEDGTTPEQWARVMAEQVAKESDETEVLWFVRRLAAGGTESGE